MLWGVRLSDCMVAGLSSALLGFGMYHVHAQSDVTEGGVLGMTLLLEYWFGISPAISGALMNVACYALGWKTLGRQFICYSACASLGFSISYGLCERFPPWWPELKAMPLLACVVGALFVGVSIGFSVKAGGAPTGDDALAMSLSRVTTLKIQWVYLLFDLTVLSLSLSYIHWSRMGYSLLTVILSGQLVGWMQKMPAFWRVGKAGSRRRMSLHEGNANRD